MSNLYNRKNSKRKKMNVQQNKNKASNIKTGSCDISNFLNNNNMQFAAKNLNIGAFSSI